MPGEHYVSHDQISCRNYHTNQHDGESKSAEIIEVEDWDLCETSEVALT